MTTPQFKSSDHPRSATGDRWVDKQQTPDELGQMSAEPSVEDRLTDVYIATGYYADSAARSQALSDLGEAEANGIDPEFYLDYISFKHNLQGDERYHIPPAETLLEAGLTVTDLVALRELDGGKLKDSTRQLIGHGITATRAAELMALGVPANAQALIAMNDASDDLVRWWTSALRDDRELQSWVRDWPTIGLFVNRFSPDRTAEFACAGIDPRSAAEGDGRFSPAEARAFALDSKLKPEQVGAYMLHNLAEQSTPANLVDAAVAKAFGPKFKPAETAELVKSGVDAKIARSLRGVDHLFNIGLIKKYAAAGIVTGAEFKVWRDLTSSDMRMTVGSGRVSDHNEYTRANDDAVKRILAAKKSGVTPEAAASYVRVAATDPAQWKPMFKAGILDAKPWAKALAGTGRANILVPREPGTVGITTAMAAWAKAGGTAEGLAAAGRAGIPVAEAHAHVNSDLWAAGAPYRARVLAAETEAFDAGRYWGQTPAAPWEWTEATYLVGTE